MIKYWEITFKNQIDFFIISQCYDVAESLEMNDDKKSIIMITKEDGAIVESLTKKHNITDFKIEEIDITLDLGLKDPINVHTPVSVSRLKAMGKYFKNKKVKITYEYNNSLGDHEIREYVGMYDKINVREVKISSGNNYIIEFLKNDVVVFEQDFQHHAEFTGLGSIEECNSGPYCYFKMGHVK